jgi:hypothetical protein
MVLDSLTKLFVPKCTPVYFGQMWIFFGGGGGQRPLMFSIISDYSFWVHHPIKQDDRHHLAHAMASEFSVPWQCLSKRTISFCVMDQSPHPNADL